MKGGVWHRMDLLSRRLTPFLLTMMLLILALVPFHVPGLSRVTPLLPLIAVYHWAVYRSENFPAVAVFVIGVVQDILTGVSLGSFTLVFLFVYGLVLSQHRYLAGKSFLVVWLGFVLAAAGACLAVWVLTSTGGMGIVEPLAAVFQYLLTIACYPFVAWLLLRWQRAVLEVT